MDYSCQICAYDFDLQEHLPKILGKCGHTICRTCLDYSISSTIKTNTNFEHFLLKCPFDNTIYLIKKNSTSEEFAKNFFLVEFLEQRGVNEKKKLPNENKKNEEETKVNNLKQKKVEKNIDLNLDQEKLKNQQEFSKKKSQKSFNQFQVRLSREHIQYFKKNLGNILLQKEKKFGESKKNLLTELDKAKNLKNEKEFQNNKILKKNKNTKSKNNLKKTPKLKEIKKEKSRLQNNSNLDLFNEWKKNKKNEIPNLEKVPKNKKSNLLQDLKKNLLNKKITKETNYFLPNNIQTNNEKSILYNTNATFQNNWKKEEVSKKSENLSHTNTTFQNNSKKEEVLNKAENLYNNNKNEQKEEYYKYMDYKNNNQFNLNNKIELYQKLSFLNDSSSKNNKTLYNNKLVFTKIPENKKLTLSVDKNMNSQKYLNNSSSSLLNDNYFKVNSNSMQFLTPIKSYRIQTEPDLVSLNRISFQNSDLTSIHYYDQSNYSERFSETVKCVSYKFNSSELLTGKKLFITHS